MQRYRRGINKAMFEEGWERIPIPIYPASPVGLYSFLMSSAVLKITPRLAKTWLTSRSAEDSSSKVLAFLSFSALTQYRGNPSKAVWSCLEQHTLKNLPLNPL